MKLLLLEIWGFLVISFLLGVFVQWFLCCRTKKSDALGSDAETSSVPVGAPIVEPSKIESTDSDKPFGLSAPPENPDELKRIKGIGAVIEETLNELGVYTFAQIAQWTPENISWVENSLAFPGRIEREDWVNQAKILSDGGSTDFSKKVDQGQVEY